MRAQSAFTARMNWSRRSPTMSAARAVEPASSSSVIGTAGAAAAYQTAPAPSAANDPRTRAAAPTRDSRGREELSITAALSHLSVPVSPLPVGRADRSGQAHGGELAAGGDQRAGGVPHVTVLVDTVVGDQPGALPDPEWPGPG